MQDELGVISRDLIEDLERARPGFPLERSGFEKAARERLHLRLSDLRAQYASIGSDADFERVQRELDDLLLRRYLTFARGQNEREREGAPSILKRLWYSFVGLAVGGFLVWAPFIPVYEKWLPFAFMLLAPALPDLQIWWSRRQHDKRLGVLQGDLDAAGRALQDSRPLTGMLDETPSRSAAASKGQGQAS
jgi:hypothetical protein